MSALKLLTCGEQIFKCLWERNTKKGAKKSFYREEEHWSLI